jgi:hypothetical protein
MATALLLILEISFLFGAGFIDQLQVSKKSASLYQFVRQYDEIIL